MRRWMIIAVGATVLVLAGVTAVVVGVILLRCCGNTDPPVQAGPSFAAGG